VSLNILRIRDAVTKKPVTKVKVELKGWVGQLFSETDANGEMPIIACPFVTYHVKLTKEGYAAMEFDITPWAPLHFIDAYMEAS